jgi:hypothetical protein
MMSEAKEIRDAMMNLEPMEKIHMEGIDLAVSAQTYLSVLEREKGREYVERLISWVEKKNEARGYYEDDKTQNPHDLNACIWTEDEDGNWRTECGNQFIMIDGNPYDNGFIFCAYCGKVLAMTPETEK